LCGVLPPSARAPREEAFVGVAPRIRPQGSKHAVAHSRFLWVDVDKPGELPALWAGSGRTRREDGGDRAK
jgi:hypothetical protein